MTAHRIPPAIRTSAARCLPLIENLMGRCLVRFRIWVSMHGETRSRRREPGFDYNLVALDVTKMVRITTCCNDQNFVQAPGSRVEMRGGFGATGNRLPERNRP
jgi:hypothetical protein